jgi:RNA polymerase sigma factor (sigma-70 family)
MSRPTPSPEGLRPAQAGAQARPGPRALPQTPEERQELVPLVQMAVRMARARARLWELPHREADFIETAQGALADGLRTWSPEGGASKKTHVRGRILGELLDARTAEGKRAETQFDDLSEPLPPRVEEDGGALAFASGISALALGPDEQLLDREMRVRLRAAIAKLPQPLKGIAERRHLRGLPWNDVAKALGIPKRTMHDYDRKLRELLAVKLRDDDDDDDTPEGT